MITFTHRQRQGFFWLGFLSSGAALLSLSDIGGDWTQSGWGNLEMSIAGPIIALRTPALTEVMKAFTFLGSLNFLVVLGALAVAFSWPPRSVRDKVAFVTLGIGSGIVNSGLKAWFGRPRPGLDYNPLVAEPYWSFPSGHSMSSFCFYFFLAYLAMLPMRTRRARVLTMLSAFTLVSLIGLSRIYLAAHYPGDVIGGFAAAWPCLWTAIAIHVRLLRSAPDSEPSSPGASASLSKSSSGCRPDE